MRIVKPPLETTPIIITLLVFFVVFGLPLVGGQGVGRPLVVTGIGDCAYTPPPMRGFEDPNQIIGKYLGGKVAPWGQRIAVRIELCINDPTLDWRIVGNVPVQGQSATFDGDVGVHYLHFQLQDVNDPNVPLDEGTLAVKVVPRAQFQGVTWLDTASTDQ